MEESPPHSDSIASADVRCMNVHRRVAWQFERPAGLDEYTAVGSVRIARVAAASPAAIASFTRRGVTSANPSGPSTAAVAFALLIVYVVWGSTYFGIAVMIEGRDGRIGA